MNADDGWLHNIGGRAYAVLPDGRRLRGMQFPGEMVWGADEPDPGTAVLGHRKPSPNVVRGELVAPAAWRCAP